MFDLAIDRKLRGCDVVEVKIGDLVSGWSGSITRNRRSAEGRAAYQFELLEASRSGILAGFGGRVKA